MADQNGLVLFDEINNTNRLLTDSSVLSELQKNAYVMGYPTPDGEVNTSTFKVFRSLLPSALSFYNDSIGKIILSVSGNAHYGGSAAIRVPDPDNLSQWEDKYKNYRYNKKSI